MTLHSQRFATETLIQLSNKIPSIEIIMEYSVKPYRIDAYIPQHNIAIEIDENDHAFYDKEKEIERSRFITQQLRCSWIRVDNQLSQQETVCYLLKQLSYYGITEENPTEQKALPLQTEPPQKSYRKQLKELKEQEAEEKARKEVEAIQARQERQQESLCLKMFGLLNLEFNAIKKEYRIPNSCRTLEDLVKSEYKNGNKFFPGQIQDLKSKYVSICSVLGKVDFEARTKYYGRCCFMTGSQGKERTRNFYLSPKIQEFICKTMSDWFNNA